MQNMLLHSPGMASFLIAFVVFNLLHSYRERYGNT